MNYWDIAAQNRKKPKPAVTVQDLDLLDDEDEDFQLGTAFVAESTNGMDLGEAALQAAQFRGEQDTARRQDRERAREEDRRAQEEYWGQTQTDDRPNWTGGYDDPEQAAAYEDWWFSGESTFGKGDLNRDGIVDEEERLAAGEGDDDSDDDDADWDDLAALQEKEREALEEDLAARRAEALQQADARSGLAGMGLSGASAALRGDVQRVQDREADLAMAELARQQSDERWQELQRDIALWDFEEEDGVDYDGDGHYGNPDAPKVETDASNTSAWALEEQYRADYNQDGYIGDPANGVTATDDEKPNNEATWAAEETDGRDWNEDGHIGPPPLSEAEVQRIIRGDADVGGYEAHQNQVYAALPEWYALPGIDDKYVTTWRANDGGAWDIYRRPDGSLYKIPRLFG